MIQAEDVRKSLGGREVLRGASLCVEEGEALAIIGTSGEGKTVFLKHLAGFFKPDSGRVLIDGHDLSSARGRELETLRERFGFLFQGGALFQSMTIYENVAFPLQEKTELDEQEIENKVLRQLQLVGLEDATTKYPAEVSGGMAKRAALARALVESPDIMFFDEPTTGLDPIIAHSIHDLIGSVREQLGLTAVIVTHEIPSIFSIIDRVAMLHDGVIRFVGTPEELFSAEDEVVDDFIHGSMPPPWYWLKTLG
jgi:phospholipid/cholesterol/gamma-HCH transport system ATP-binding protein